MASTIIWFKLADIFSAGKKDIDQFMSEESIKTSDELIRWLKMVALPAWARRAAAAIMLPIFGDAFALGLGAGWKVEVTHG
ncbi:hypothetical protein [Rhodoferax sp.]|uniref:hypothetical protein n=1 Tax=Rhodoferax sp. TaxID=50421 RepID=UPI00374DA8CA